VSANSLVVADIPPGVTVMGVPGKLIFSQLRN
jgi:serine acetyltransferase